MENDLRISLLQFPVEWERKEKNLQACESRLKRSKGKTDLVVLPEMFTTGFSMNAQALAEEVTGETVSAVRRWAAAYDMAVAGSFIAFEDGHYYNRAFFVTPDGQACYYDKRHLFSMAGETGIYTAGCELPIVSYRGWKVCLQICYDLRFPVWSRNRNYAYDLLIYMANWPDVRSSAWQPLLQARAIENQAYVCGVNRTGMDGKGFNYAGDSVLFSPKGERMGCACHRRQCLLTRTLSAGKLATFRKKFPVAVDGDSFLICPSSAGKPD